MRPADQRDAVARDVGARREIAERAERIEPPLRRSHGPLAVLDRADLAHAARAKAVGEQHRITFAQIHFGAQRHPFRQFLLVAVARSNTCRRNRAMQ